MAASYETSGSLIYLILYACDIIILVFAINMLCIIAHIDINIVYSFSN